MLIVRNYYRSVQLVQIIFMNVLTPMSLPSLTELLFSELRKDFPEVLASRTVVRVSPQPSIEVAIGQSVNVGYLRTRGYSIFDTTRDTEPSSDSTSHHLIRVSFGS